MRRPHEIYFFPFEVQFDETSVMCVCVCVCVGGGREGGREFQLPITNWVQSITSRIY